MSTSDKRKAVADQTIQRSLLRKHPGLTDGALQFLMDAARSSIEYRSHLAGEALDVTSLVNTVERSDAGQLIFHTEQETNTAPDHVKAVDGMTPQQKINYAC